MCLSNLSRRRYAKAVFIGSCNRTARSSRVSVRNGSRKVDDRAFYSVGPETAKLLCPYLVVGARYMYCKIAMCCRTEMTSIDIRRHWCALKIDMGMGIAVMPR